MQSLESTPKPPLFVVQQCLPGFMIALAIESLQKKTDWEVRADFLELSNKASVVPIQAYTGDVQEMARAIEDAGHRILRAANADSLPTLLAAICFMLVRFQKRGVEIEENALMIAAAIGDEATEEGGYGSTTTISRVADRLENEARKLGFFSHLVLLHPNARH